MNLLGGPGNGVHVPYEQSNLDVIKYDVVDSADKALLSTTQCVEHLYVRLDFVVRDGYHKTYRSFFIWSDDVDAITKQVRKYLNGDTERLTYGMLAM